jgi:hypothetical protein
MEGYKRQWKGSVFNCKCGAVFQILEGIEHAPLACPGCSGIVEAHTPAVLEPGDLVNALDDPARFQCNR